MVISKDALLVESVRRLRNHGMEAHGPLVDLMMPGLNYRLGETGAALGINQLNDLPERITERQKLANYYRELLAQISGVSLQKTSTDATVAWQAFVVRLQGRTNATVIKRLKEKGIETTIGAHALHVLRFFREKYRFLPSDYPNAEKLFAECLAVPFYNGMSPETAEAVVNGLKEALDENRAYEGE